MFFSPITFKFFRRGQKANRLNSIVVVQDTRWGYPDATPMILEFIGGRIHRKPQGFQYIFSWIDMNPSIDARYVRVCLTFSLKSCDETWHFPTFYWLFKGHAWHHDTMASWDHGMRRTALRDEVAELWSPSNPNVGTELRWTCWHVWDQRWFFQILEQAASGFFERLQFTVCELETHHFWSR
jgi:hypothetical protein